MGDIYRAQVANKTTGTIKQDGAIVSSDGYNYDAYNRNADNGIGSISVGAITNKYTGIFPATGG
jgi:hypothetical protein